VHARSEGGWERGRNGELLARKLEKCLKVPEEYEIEKLGSGRDCLSFGQGVFFCFSRVLT
jgi:hypothetical protein